MEKPILLQGMGESTIDPGIGNNKADSKAIDRPFQESLSDLLSEGDLMNAAARLKGMAQASEISFLPRVFAARLQSEPSAAPKPYDRFATESLALLSPLVETILHDANGQLDLAKVPAKNFQEFKRFLLAQVAVDGMAFNDWASESFHWNGLWDSYRRVLASPKFEPLLERLYASTHPEAEIVPELSGTEAKRLLQSFSHEIMSVSTDRFAGAHLESKEGRQRLREILEDEGVDFQLKTDLIRSIGRAKAEEGDYKLHVHQIRDLTSTFDAILFSANVHNWRVKEEDIAAAARHALRILETADYSEQFKAKQRGKYENSPEHVSLLRGASLEDLQRYVDLAGCDEDQLKSKSRKLDAKAELRAALAGLWLLIADDANWRYDEAHSKADLSHFPEIRRNILSQVDGYVEKLGKIESPWQFQALNREIRTFLKSPPDPLANVALRKADAFLQNNFDLPSGLNERLEDFVLGMDSTQREPFDRLTRFSDEIWAASEMGEALRLEIPTQARGFQLKEAADSFVHGLETAKRKLWAGYKQQGAVSRGLSQTAEAVGVPGAVATIRAGNAAIDEVIAAAQEAKNPEDLKMAYAKLYEKMKDGGRLHAAFKAAEIDGIEQLIGLGQSMLEMLAISAATEGVGTASVALRAFGGAAKGMQRVSTASKALFAGEKAFKGFRLGAQLSLADNLAAKLSGQMSESDTFLSWAKDALATGASMALTAPFGEGVDAGKASKPVLRQLWSRYTQGVPKGLKHFAVDGLAEATEEFSDALLRENLDGKRDGLDGDRFRDIAGLTMLGGGVHRGLSSALIVGKNHAAISPNITFPQTRSHRRDFLKNPILAPMWAAMGAGGLGGTDGKETEADRGDLRDSRRERDNVEEWSISEESLPRKERAIINLSRFRSAVRAALKKIERREISGNYSFFARLAHRIYCKGLAKDQLPAVVSFEQLMGKRGDPEVVEWIKRSSLLQKWKRVLDPLRAREAFKAAFDQVERGGVRVTRRAFTLLTRQIYCEGLPEDEHPELNDFVKGTSALGTRDPADIGNPGLINFRKIMFDDPEVSALLAQSDLIPRRPAVKQKWVALDAGRARQSLKEAGIRIESEGIVKNYLDFSNLAHQIYCANLPEDQRPDPAVFYYRVSIRDSDLGIDKLLSRSKWIQKWAGEAMKRDSLEAARGKAAIPPMSPAMRKALEAIENSRGDAAIPKTIHFYIHNDPSPTVIARSIRPSHEVVSIQAGSGVWTTELKHLDPWDDADFRPAFALSLVEPFLSVGDRVQIVGRERVKSPGQKPPRQSPQPLE